MDLKIRHLFLIFIPIGYEKELVCFDLILEILVIGITLYNYFYGILWISIRTMDKYQKDISLPIIKFIVQ